MRALILSILCLAATTMMAQTTQKEGAQARVYDKSEVDKRAEFTGGEMKLMEYLMRNLSYPAEAQKEKKDGRVMVQFVVEADGFISDVKLDNSIHPALDKEALRVIRQMPKWKPALLKNVPVRSRESLPITFRLK